MQIKRNMKTEVQLACLIGWIGLWAFAAQDTNTLCLLLVKVWVLKIPVSLMKNADDYAPCGWITLTQCCRTFLTPWAAQDIIMKPWAASVNSIVTKKNCWTLIGPILYLCNCNLLKLEVVHSVCTVAHATFDKFYHSSVTDCHKWSLLVFWISFWKNVQQIKLLRWTKINRGVILTICWILASQQKVKHHNRRLHLRFYMRNKTSK